MANRSITYHDGGWHEGNPPLLGPMDHGWWMASSVFDGARAIGGLGVHLVRTLMDDLSYERTTSGRNHLKMVAKIA